MLDLFLRGEGRLGSNEWWGYTSLRHAIQTNDRLRQLVDRSNVKEAGMWLRMKALYKQRYGCDLQKINIISKCALQPATKQKRRAKAKAWKAWGKKRLRDVVWIDEKQEYLKAGGKYRCYAPHGVKSMQRASDVKLGRAAKVKYEAAVSGFAGPVYFKFITGTSGLSTGSRVRPINMTEASMRTIIPVRRDPGPARRRARAPRRI